MTSIKYHAAILYETTKFDHRKYAALAIFSMIISISVLSYSVLQGYVADNMKPIQSKILDTAFYIENLKSKKTSSVFSWHIMKDMVLNVNVINSDEYPDKFNLIKNAVLSEETMRHGDSHSAKVYDSELLFMGWKGVLNHAKSLKDTKLNLPADFYFTEYGSSVNDIVIELTSLTNGDGFLGKTRVLVDEKNSQILKAYITIYDVDNLSNEEFSAIIRHEFGHALGLSHSDNVDDLMYFEINTKFPFITECDMEVLLELYDQKDARLIECYNGKTG